MITVADPQILWNDGFYPLVDVTIPDGSYWKPKHPAALNARNHGIGRVFDLFGGLLGQTNPALLNAAGFSSSPHFMYSGQLLRSATARASGSSSTRSASAASPAGRSATARTGTRCGPASSTSRASSWSRTTRCGSRSGRRSPTPAAPGCTAAATGSTSPTGSSRARHHRHPRRPLADLPVGRQRRRARRPRHQVDRPGRRQPRGAAEQVPRRAGAAGRRAALRHLGRWRLGRPAGAGPGAGRARGAPRPGQRRRGRAGTGWWSTAAGALDAAATDGLRAELRAGPARRAAGVRHGPGDSTSCWPAARRRPACPPRRPDLVVSAEPGSSTARVRRPAGLGRPAGPAADRPDAGLFTAGQPVRSRVHRARSSRDRRCWSRGPGARACRCVHTGGALPRRGWPTAGCSSARCRLWPLLADDATRRLREPMPQVRPARRRAGDHQAVRVGVLRHLAGATLRAPGVDTVVIAGVSTSGCIRASATDAMQHGFRPIVVRDACADRTDELHEVQPARPGRQVRRRARQRRGAGPVRRAGTG